MGVLVNNQWSVGGAPGRPSVNFFTAQYFFNYNFPGGHGWYFTTSPLIIADWTAAPGQQWTVPVGGGFGRLFKVGDQPISALVRDFTMSSAQITLGPGRCACRYHSCS